MRNRYLVAALAVVLGCAAFITYRVRSQRLAFADAPPPAVQAVTIAPARYGRLVETLSLDGTVIFPADIKLSPQVAGILQALYVAEGQAVRKGQLLAVIDHGEMDAQQAQAEAGVRGAQANLDLAIHGAQREQLEQAQAALHQAEAGLVGARNDYRRFKDLNEMQAITRQQFEQATTRLQVSQQEVATARAALRQLQAGTRPEQIAALRAQVQGARAGVRLMEAQVANHLLRAPVSGRITQKFADPGTLVAPTAPLLSLAQAGRPQVEVTVPETEVDRLRPGQRVRVTIPERAGMTLLGRVATISPIVDPQARLVKARVYLDGSLALAGVRGGMLVDVAVDVASYPRALLVPTSAVNLDAEGHASVFVVGANGQARKKPVQVVARQDAQTAVGGLRPGERVVASGSAFIKDGDPVNVQPPLGQ